MMNNSTQEINKTNSDESSMRLTQIGAFAQVGAVKNEQLTYEIDGLKKKN
jgi:hypothetical protein